MSGKRSRDKGGRIEREIVALHKGIDVKAKKVSRMYAPGHDIDIYVHGDDYPPMIGEVKSRSSGQGFTTIKRWLGSDNDVLFLREDGEREPLVVLPWRSWKRLLNG